MASIDGTGARQTQVRQDGGVAAILHQAAALASGNGDLLAPQGPLRWQSWTGGKGGHAESLPLPSPADLLESKGMLEQRPQHQAQRESHRQGLSI